MHADGLRLAISVATAATLAIAACTPTPDPTTAVPAASAAAPVPQRGAGGTLNIRVAQAPGILSVWFFQRNVDAEAALPVIEPLASVGPDGRPVAVLAAEIPTVANGGVANDFTSATWKLKPQVKWSDGSEFTSADVVFTWKFISDDEARAGNPGLANLVKSVEALDKLTVKVTYAAPRHNPYLIFGSDGWEIIQQQQFKDFTGARAREAPGHQGPIGTGPYKVKEFTANVGVTYEINEHYREPNKPFFKEVVIKGSGDPLSAARAVFETGESDFSVIGDGVEGAALKRMIGSPDSQGVVIANVGRAVERLLFNRTDPDPALGDLRSEPGRPHPFLADLRVRQALAIAVDRKPIADLFAGGLGGEATCNIVIGVPAYTSQNTAGYPVCRFDLVAANKLLDEAGWAKGADGVRQKAGVRMKVVLATTVDPRREGIHALLKDTWSKIGVETELKAVVSGKFFDNKGDDRAAQFFADVILLTNSWIPPEVQPYLRSWTTAEIKTRAANWTGANYERWSNSEYDALFAQLRGEMDEAKRSEIVIAMNDLLVRDVVVVPLVARKAVVGFAKSLKGYDSNTSGPWTVSIANWSK